MNEQRRFRSLTPCGAPAWTGVPRRKFSATAATCVVLMKAASLGAARPPAQLRSPADGAACLLFYGHARAATRIRISRRASKCDGRLFVLIEMDASLSLSASLRHDLT